MTSPLSESASGQGYVHPGRLRDHRAATPWRPTADGLRPAEVVPVRLDPELRAAVEARATADDTTTSEIIREALRRFLHVP